MDNNTKIFDSVGAFASFLDHEPIRPLFAAHPASVKSSASFAGSASFEAASDLLRYGDKENAQKLFAGHVSVSVLGSDLRPRRVASVAGFVPNVPAYLRGLPLNMYATEKTRVQSKVLNICYCPTASAHVAAAELVAAGAAVASAVLSLEKSGYSVNLYAGFVSITTGRRSSRGRVLSESASAFVRIKSAGAYMDKNLLAYPLVNPSFLRRHIFAYIERCPGLTLPRWPDGYGRPGSDSEHEEIFNASGLRGVCLTFYGVRGLDSSDICKKILSRFS